jgi:hypothetical protein
LASRLFNSATASGGEGIIPDTISAVATDKAHFALVAKMVLLSLAVVVVIV